MLCDDVLLFSCLLFIHDMKQLGSWRLLTLKMESINNSSRVKAGNCFVLLRQNYFMMQFIKIFVPKIALKLQLDYKIHHSCLRPWFQRGLESAHFFHFPPWYYIIRVLIWQSSNFSLQYRSACMPSVPLDRMCVVCPSTVNCPLITRSKVSFRHKLNSGILLIATPSWPFFCLWKPFALLPTTKMISRKYTLSPRVYTASKTA